jgi:hypothetical protein
MLGSLFCCIKHGLPRADVNWKVTCIKNTAVLHYVHRTVLTADHRIIVLQIQVETEYGNLKRNTSDLTISVKIMGKKVKQCLNTPMEAQGGEEV